MSEENVVKGAYSETYPEGFVISNGMEILKISGAPFAEAPQKMGEVKVTVQYTLDDGAIAPKRGREADIAHDLYTLEDVVLFPNALASTIVKTGLHTAFDSQLFGLFVNLRSGVAKYPVMLGNHQGVIEGEYRGDIGLPLRNTYVSNGQVSLSEKILTIAEDGSLTSKNLSQLTSVDFQGVFHNSAKAYGKEQSLLGVTEQAYDELIKVYKIGYCPTGTLYIPKGTRMAQAFLLPRFNADFVQVDALPDSTRGTQGFGSSGVK